MARNRKNRNKNSQNGFIPRDLNGHNRQNKSSDSTVLLVNNGTKTKTTNKVENLNRILDSEECEDDDEYEEDIQTQSLRSKKIWLFVIGLAIVGVLIGNAVNGIKQYQSKSIPTSNVIDDSSDKEKNGGEEKSKNSQVPVKSESQSEELSKSEKDSYFDLAQEGYRKVIDDYVSSNGFRLYTQALGQQSKGKSAHRLLVGKLQGSIKQHELIIGKNESIAVTNPDVMKLLSVSLEMQSIQNALQRLCQSQNTCDGSQDFNDFTVPSADALVHVRLYAREEITAYTQSQEFQIRKQIIQEEARKKPINQNAKQEGSKSEKVNSNNSDLQRSN